MREQDVRGKYVRPSPENLVTAGRVAKEHGTTVARQMALLHGRSAKIGGLLGLDGALASI